MSDTLSTTVRTHTTEEIREWLIQRIAYYLELAPEAVDPSVALVEIGLDSVYGLSVVGDLEDHFDITAEPTLAWDCPTIDAITAHLADQLGIA